MLAGRQKRPPLMREFSARTCLYRRATFSLLHLKFIVVVLLFLELYLMFNIARIPYSRLTAHYLIQQFALVTVNNHLLFFDMFRILQAIESGGQVRRNTYNKCCKRCAYVYMKVKYVINCNIIVSGSLWYRPKHQQATKGRHSLIMKMTVVRGVCLQPKIEL